MASKLLGIYILNRADNANVVGTEGIFIIQFIYRFFLCVVFLEIELVMHTSYLASVNLLTHKCSSETESSNK